MPEKGNMKMESVIITSALPYANGEIHLGHIASTYLPADIFTRYCRLVGKQAFHLCATDDFGTPILIRAEQENKSPTEYVQYWNRRDQEDFVSVGISFDIFSSTSSNENTEFVQYVFEKLYENGHIYEKNIIQFYCPFDNKFLPDRFVKGKCPNCGALDQYSDLCEICGRVPGQILDPKCGICGSVPVRKESNHYFFRLSNFSQKLKDWLLSSVNFQEEVKKYVLNWIDEGLVDWDITRDIEWGIPIPRSDSKGKVFYGWFDNHLCYISALIALVSSSKTVARKLWNDSQIFHFIGKDIVYHHYLFLPAIRMGIEEEYKLPDFMPTRGHLMLYNRKISKSRDWYIGLKDFTNSFDPDYLRFYLASITSYSQDDINFDWDSFREKINNELIANIGNFINRTLSFIHKAFDAKVPRPSSLDSEDEFSLSQIRETPLEVSSLISNNELDKALKRILRFSCHFNRYFQKNEPWSSKDRSSTTLYICVNAVRSLAILLEPFIPFSCEKIWYQLNAPGLVHTQDWYSSTILSVEAGHTIRSVAPIFRKIEQEEILKKKSMRLIETDR